MELAWWVKPAQRSVIMSSTHSADRSVTCTINPYSNLGPAFP